MASEFQAAKAALANVSPVDLGRKQFLGVDLEHIRETQSNLSSTYFLRLTAETERAMRIHLSTHFPAVQVRPSDGFGRLVGKVARNYHPGTANRMPAHLVSPVRDLILFRNVQAHGIQGGITFPPFATAKRDLSRFLFELP